MGQCCSAPDDADGSRAVPGTSTAAAGARAGQSTAHLPPSAPLRTGHLQWTAAPPGLTRDQLERRREEYWATSPAYGGRAEVWDALRAICNAVITGDHDMVPALVDAAGISIPTGDLTEAAGPEGGAYDVLGNKYVVPSFCLVSPTNLLASPPPAPTSPTRPIASSQSTVASATDIPMKPTAAVAAAPAPTSPAPTPRPAAVPASPRAEVPADPTSDEGPVVHLTCRPSAGTHGDAVVRVGVRAPIARLKARLAPKGEPTPLDPAAMRVMYLGRIYGDERKVGELPFLGGNVAAAEVTASGNGGSAAALARHIVQVMVLDR
ncbi:Ubiquitin domain-containing protein 2 [Allomyces arbusculus]|nr:Ubiquitin domain-containing protein 2 [Allomyces arbusculus]